MNRDLEGNKWWMSYGQRGSTGKVTEEERTVMLKEW